MNNAIDDLLNVYAYWWASGAADPADRAREEESCRLAEEALRKQEGMKPSGGSEYSCMVCERDVAYGDEYCWHCGQKLNWEE